MNRRHSKRTIEQAQWLFENEGLCCRRIAERMRIPTRTVSSWKIKYGWVEGEVSTESMIATEYKRVLLKPELSPRDLRKLKALGAILDEYRQHRSGFQTELIGAIKKIRSSSIDKQKALVILTDLVERHTGTRFKPTSHAKPNDFTRIEFAPRKD